MKIKPTLVIQDVVPVVMGGLSDAEYDKFAPPRSYLNVRDFQSVSDLARKLESLAANETAYREYFWWTDQYRVQSLSEAFNQAQCQLCELLNHVKRGQVSLPPVDLRTFWNSHKWCRPPP